jgi:hypothetical protein
MAHLMHQRPTTCRPREQSVVIVNAHRFKRPDRLRMQSQQRKMAMRRELHGERPGAVELIPRRLNQVGQAQSRVIRHEDIRRQKPPQVDAEHVPVELRASGSEEHAFDIDDRRSFGRFLACQLEALGSNRSAAGWGRQLGLIELSSQFGGVAEAHMGGLNKRGWQVRCHLWVPSFGPRYDDHGMSA